MEQTSIFSEETWLDALRADVESAGGLKIVGHAFWPKLDPDTAGRKLSNALNAKQIQKLCYSQVIEIKQLARRAVGHSALHAHESAKLECDLVWLTDEMLDQRSLERIASLAAEQKLEAERMAARKRK